MVEFILGGARSGKSRLAMDLAEASQRPVTYVATAESRDAEMAARIALHQQERPTHWQLIEEPLQLASVIQQTPAQHCLLIDCLTLWLSNWLLQNNDQAWQQAQKTLLETLKTCEQHIILVSNETGLGVVPMGQLSRQFVDATGFLHQRIAALADQVYFSLAGLTLPLKLQGKACFQPALPSLSTPPWNT